VSGVSDSGTIFVLWVEEPTFSNTKGTISFGGGLPGAYKGESGLLFTITFRVKKAGETKVQFTAGHVLASDGKGTDILNSFGSATYTLAEKKETKQTNTEKPLPRKPEPSTVSRGIKPPRPEVSSDTHPDPEKWYSNNDPEFRWKLLSDLSGVSIGYSTDPEGDPGPRSDGIIEYKKYNDIEDGIYYFHIKYQNRVGWGPVGHRKFMVDATPPELYALEIYTGGDPTNPNPTIKFQSTDATSGIDYYKIKIDDIVRTVKPEEVPKGEYKPGILAPGEHTIAVVAYDKAGNSASSTLKFSVEGLKPPVITDIPKYIKTNEELIIRGASFYSDATIKIYIAPEGKEEEPEVVSTKTDTEGNWAYFHKRELKEGNYEIWAKLIDKRGAESLPTTKHILTVEALSIVEAYGWIIIAVLLLIILGLLLLLFYQHYKFEEERKRISQETDEAHTKLTEIFNALKEEVDELMELADKRPGLSESERRVKEKLQEALDISEEFLAKELEDVKKEIRIRRQQSKGF
ncbi:hypothetical protein D6821_00635, partial [Candidatus Parcubacteria bacterium]